MKASLWLPVDVKYVFIKTINAAKTHMWTNESSQRCKYADDGIHYNVRGKAIAAML